MTNLLPVEILKAAIENRNLVKDNLNSYHDTAGWETFQLAMRLLNPQSYGAQFERRIREAYGWSKNKAKDRNGDANFIIEKVSINTEIKVSVITNIDKTVNIVQVRPSHAMDYYDIFVISQDSSVTHYRLSKSEMKAELELTGNRLAHGTIGNEDASFDNAEFRIDFVAIEGNPVYDRWSKYVINDTDILTGYIPNATVA